MTFNDVKNLNLKSLLFLCGIPFFIKLAFIAVVLNPSQSYSATAPESFADLAERLLPTVVNISTTQKIEEEPQPNRRMAPFQMSPQFPEGHPFNDFFDEFFNRHFDIQPSFPRQNIPSTSLGSGFIIDQDKGMIVTNNHVIDGADEIEITLHDDTTLPATIVGTDKKTDIAILKANLKGQKIAEAKLGDSDVMRVGDWVVAIGNPFGLGGTVTAGIISARQRDINSGPYDDYLQTDASINRGNSGGPMFNIDGEVIGINTAIFSPTGGSVGIGFAIPSALAQSVIDQIIQFGRTKRGWLGVKIQEVTDDIADSLGLKKAAGALVAETTPTGPAEKAGIQAGDIILAFDNKPVREMRDLPRIVAETDIDKDVHIVIWRSGSRVNLKANIGELEKAEEDGLLAAHQGSNIHDNSEDDHDTSSDNIVGELGLTLDLLTPQTRSIFSIDKGVKGLVVMDADPQMDAAQKGIDAGDVLVAANQKPLTSMAVLKDEIERTVKSGRETILLLINRHGSIQFVAVKIAKNDKDVQ